jgi:uncharacterized radical SAM superfamily protein
MILSLKRNIGLLLILSMLYATLGCKEEINEPSESEVTIAFFDAIYNQKDLKTVLSLSSKSFTKEIKKYKTLNNFSRRALNLSFDSVTMETQKSNTKVIDEFNIQVVITVMLTGLRNERIYKEVKQVQLIKNNNTWLIDKLLKS